MCCFTRKVVEVENTRIFARLGSRGNQVLIYQMALNSLEDLAMVLPVPVKPGSGEDAMTFFDFSKYEAIFDDLGKLFPELQARSFGDPFAAAVPAQGAVLRVVNVGAYEASYVPKIADFSRLDERFRLPEQVWAKLPGYREFGFAVFKLKSGNAQVHPMAFAFPTATPQHLYFPTLHIHDGKVHTKEDFDHTLYLQGDDLDLRSQGWEESPGPAVTKVKCGFTHAMVRPEMHVYRHVMHGVFENGDVTVPVRKV